ncbi:bifunctional 4-hydroxy-2-oxoglutarate aldolase/2-dehydro-3-deoxy-phosphogluconate aldolase [Actinoplanes sp. NPDC048967]|uniref:bifunctional 4-hydroxy-2-oxoglutarate aldolase/2-dehydro-3-deoxy-phosphogluconate aldolase n=1 Tax=Actinoplanes sp. NPDC048967 TaxID=3155269 RepID=UPI0033D06838
MTVHETWQQLADHALVPVVVLDDPAAARPLGQALVDGGLPVAEVTLRTPEALKGIQELAGHGGLLVGAGTVLTPRQVELAVEAGARYVVSPGLSRAVVERCQALGVPVLPGAVTATEVQAAIELGLEAVKFFPAATSGGPAAVAALAAPFADMRFVPTGGIDAGNVADYLALPAVLAVGGSWMVPRAAIRAGDFARIHELTSQAVAATRGR